LRRRQIKGLIFMHPPSLSIIPLIILISFFITQWNVNNHSEVTNTTTPAAGLVVHQLPLQFKGSIKALLFMHSETHPATAGRPLLPHSASILLLLLLFFFTMHHPASPLHQVELGALAMASESAGYITDPDKQPFSPSVFLNLPPTPPDDGQDPSG
jgi:hypothetical protein